jgi:hypothetical protein
LLAQVKQPPSAPAPGVKQQPKAPLSLDGVPANKSSHGASSPAATERKPAVLSPASAAEYKGS